MRKIALLLTLLLGITTLSAILAVEAQDDAIYGLVTDYEIDVRIGPDFAYNIIDVLPRDASVAVLGRTGDRIYGFSGREWLKIEYGGQVGWVLGRVIRLGIPFNQVPLAGVILPRDRNGRIPKEFDLSVNICDRWTGSFNFSGNFMAGDQQATVTFPEMPGTTVYSVVTIAPSGLRRAFDSYETTYNIQLGALNYEPGVYQWGVIPLWNDTTDPQRAQTICLFQSGGTFEKPDTTPVTATPGPTPAP
jgi:hypothetical protein